MVSYQGIGVNGAKMLKNKMASHRVLTIMETERQQWKRGIRPLTPLCIGHKIDPLAGQFWALEGVRMRVF